MTVIKQKAVSSSRHAKNVRKYINGKDALARGGWNLPYNKYWYAKMARTRKSFGHDKPARAGAKNTIMYHQVLAFLPEECSCNGGKMTPDACMAYAEQWLAKHYPHQQVILALHEESDKEGKRFAVHMAINRTDLLTGKRLWEGTGAQAKHKRASWVREMDEAWNLTQLEKGKKNSKIRDRQPRDIEKEIVDRGEYSYKNNLRELIHLAINEGHPKNMEQFKKFMEKFIEDQKAENDAFRKEVKDSLSSTATDFKQRTDLILDEMKSIQSDMKREASATRRAQNSLSKMVASFEQGDKYAETVTKAVTDGATQAVEETVQAGTKAIDEVAKKSAKSIEKLEQAANARAKRFMRITKPEVMVNIAIWIAVAVASAIILSFCYEFFTK